MKKISIGILGASKIAFKRFLPSLAKSKSFKFAGIASRNVEQCMPFIELFGGKCYPSYDALLADSEIDCVYLPLPPALHAFWGEKALKNGKHIFMEKPFSTSLLETKRLLECANENHLAVHENYMFIYHDQFNKIWEIISSQELGNLRMIRTAFTFPFRGNADFRYNPKLGGGALYDCGGYPILLASELLGETAHLSWVGLHYDLRYGVDTAGSVVMQNKKELTAHIFFGMDDTYRCELEVWGSTASLTAKRIFTAPPDSSITLQLCKGNEIKDIKIPPDDQFLNSIETFATLIRNPDLREERCSKIIRQSALIDRIYYRNLEQ